MFFLQVYPEHDDELHPVARSGNTFYGAKYG